MNGGQACILSDSGLRRFRRTARGRVGLTSGVFDLFHRGHRNYLLACRRQCDVLLVGVDADALVRRRKGPSRPVQPSDTRLRKLADSGLADALFLKQSSAEQLLRTLVPDICFVSAARQLSAVRVQLQRDLGIPLVSIPYTQGISTTHLLGGRKVPPRQMAG